MNPIVLKNENLEKLYSTKTVINFLLHLNKVVCRITNKTTRLQSNENNGYYYKTKNFNFSVQLDSCT